MLLLIFMQVLSIKYMHIPVLSILLIVITIGFLIYRFFNHLPFFLIFLSLISFVYIDDTFNYDLLLILLQDTPIYILAIVALLTYSYSEDFFSFKLTYLKIPIILLFLFSVLAALIGFLNNNQLYYIFYEFNNLFYFCLAIPIIYLIKDPEYHKKIGIIILIVSLIVAFQYIFVNLTTKWRFTSFHAGIFPIVGGTLFSFLLFYKNNIKALFFSGIGLLIVLIGTYLTLTRSLWISVLASLFFVLLVNKVISRIKTLVIIIIVTLTLFFLSDSFSGSTNNGNTSEAQKRVQTVVTPETDISFLMRLELGYYAFQKFLENPIWGTGLADNLSYVLFSELQVYYLDNSWLYFLWKGGLIGFLIFFILFYRLFREAFYIFKNADNPSTAIYSLGIMSGLIGLFIFSFFSANLIKYSKTNLIYALIFAYVDVEANRIRKISDMKNVTPPISQ